MSNEFRTGDAAQVLTGISHELRNILQSISGCNQLIEDALLHHQFDRVESFWRIAQQQQEVLSQVVQDILFLGEHGIPPSVEIRLMDIVNRSVRSVSRKAEFAGVTLDCDLSNANAAKLSYPDILQRCVQNVLEFSICSCRENSHGRVSVNVYLDGVFEAASIEIVDNGGKLTVDELKLFSLPLAEIENWNQLGISLAVSRKIAIGLGGELDARNIEGPGKSFILTLSTPKGTDSDHARH